jgi:hypothetical protein
VRREDEAERERSLAVERPGMGGAAVDDRPGGKIEDPLRAVELATHREARGEVERRDEREADAEGGE